MSDPKLHHYVPQFHLRRFTDSGGKIWAWDRQLDRVFKSNTKAVAAENQFYRLNQFAAAGHDPSTMEKQFSTLEGDVAAITSYWLAALRSMASVGQVAISQAQRETISIYLALQHLRTADVREILSGFASKGKEIAPSREELQDIHTQLLWDEEIVGKLSKQFEESIWLFARTTTNNSLITSDNPICFRTSSNRQWLRRAWLGNDTYAVFPLAPDIVLYCYPRNGRWQNLSRFEDGLSPVGLTSDMVDSENSGQVFMASRFIFSNHSDFSSSREFSVTIGTDIFADSSASPALDPASESP